LSQTAKIFIGDENLVKMQPETAQFAFFFSPSWCIFSSFCGKDGNLGSPAPDRAMLLPWLLKKHDAVDKAASGDKSAQFDAALLARMETGDQAALAALFDRYSRMVLGIAYRVLRDRGESEELVQDIFLYVHQNVARHDPSRGTVKAWIVQLAYYRALNRRLFLTRRRFYDGTDLEVVENNILGSRDPEEELLSRDGHENLEKVFAELSGRQRMTLELFFVEGLTLREISQRIDEPLCNVRHHYYRGLEKLRDSSVVAKIWNER
jgi:RNA polymerase sigma-70 factor (ECF subfamily)